MNAGAAFEDMVHQAVKSLFVDCKITRSALIHITSSRDPNEIDFIVEFDNVVFVMEVTTDMSLGKAKGDIDKMRTFRKATKYINEYGSEKGVRGFFLTPSSPSSHVINFAREGGQWIEALSLSGFVSKFSGADLYISRRKDKDFGSVRNPISDSGRLERDVYVDVPIINRRTGDRFNLSQAYELMSQKRLTRFILTGDFGVGKSMFFRELFYRFADAFESGKSQTVPIYINARNVSFQDHNEPRDIIEDHLKWCGCREIADKFSCIWPNGNIVLFIDGFDEYLRDIPSVTGHTELAIASTQFVRKFLRECPASTPVLICGRENYFDGREQTLQSILGTMSYDHFSTSEMSEKHTRMILAKYYQLPKSQALPEWLPFRPLLLTYIFGYLHNRQEQKPGGVLQDMSILDPGRGWNTLLDRLCMRDVETKNGGDPTKSRRMLEVLSLRARGAKFNGVFDQNDVMNAYRYVYEVSSTYFDVRTIMRHCGLVPATTELTRRFVDENFENALSGGALISALEDCLSGIDRDQVVSDLALRLYSGCAKPISSVGIDVAIDRLRDEKYRRSFFATFQGVLSNRLTPPQLKGDAIALLFRLCEKAEQAVSPIDNQDTGVQSAVFSEITILPNHLRLPKITFSHCIFGNLVIDVPPGELQAKIEFVSCEAEELTLTSENGWSLNDAVSGLTAENRKVTSDTNADILASDISDGLKALKICLNKLYDQSISGRNITAFYRGIGRLPRYIIDDVLSDLRKNGLAYEVKGGQSTVIHPSRQGRARATSILKEKANLPDALFTKYALLKNL